MDFEVVVTLCFLGLLFLLLIRALFGYALSIKTTCLIDTYNKLCILQNKYECCLNYDEAEKSILYQMLCPWVITVRQCLTKNAWKKVKLVGGKEKEIKEEVERLIKNV